MRPDIKIEAAKLGLSGDALEAFCRAYTSRGPLKPLKRPPSPAKDVRAFAAWHAGRAATHAMRWGYLPADCGVAGMMMFDRDGAARGIFEQVFDAVTAEMKRRAAGRSTTLTQL